MHAGAERSPLPVAWDTSWDGRSALALPGGGWLRLEGATGFETPLRVHARQGGEKIRLPGRDHRHALKHVLQTLAVPPWDRERLPLLSSADGALLAAGDRVLSADLADWLQAHDAHLAWTP